MVYRCGENVDPHECIDSRLVILHVRSHRTVEGLSRELSFPVREGEGQRPTDLTVVLPTLTLSVESRTSPSVYDFHNLFVLSSSDTGVTTTLVVRSGPVRYICTLS